MVQGHGRLHSRLLAMRVCIYIMCDTRGDPINLFGELSARKEGIIGKKNIQGIKDNNEVDKIVQRRERRRKERRVLNTESEMAFNCRRRD